MRNAPAKSLGVAFAVVAASASAALLLTGGAEQSVQIGAGVVQNPTAGVSVTIPDGWQELARAERPAPDEVLVVGTAARPAGEPIEGCGSTNAVPNARSGYVTVYEYSNHGPFPSPSGGWDYPYDAFQPRPPDFASQYGMGNDCDLTGQLTDLPVIADISTSTMPTTTLPPPVNHVREFAFTEADRAFLVRIVTVDDGSADLLEQAFTIVNSLTVDVPSVTTTTVYVGPSEEKAARQEILDAMTAAFGGTTPIPSDEAIEGGHPFADPQDAEEAKTTASTSDDLTRKAYAASRDGGIVVRINWLEWDSPTRATLNFDLLVNDQPVTANTTGYAVFEGSHWRMGRQTFCEIVRRGGVQCE